MGAQVRRLRLWADRIDTDVEISGQGPPLLYLHGPWGLPPDRPFIATLAKTHMVHAPCHPGTTPGDADAVHRLDSWLDLVVYHGELFERLGLERLALVGHSFGALVATELAAALPHAIERLVLIDPVGLWRDDLPVKNWMLLGEEARNAAMFADSAGSAARQFFAVPDDAAARVETLSRFVWAQACTGKFVWPIPDRGLKRRIHRVAAPTLIVWGALDGIVAPAYAQEFAYCIAGSRVEIIEKAGHLPHLEQPAVVASAVQQFLRDDVGTQAPLPQSTRK